MNSRSKELAVSNLVAIVDYDRDGETVCVVNKKYAPMVAGALEFSYHRYFHCLTSSDGDPEMHENTIESYLGLVQHVQCSKADFESFAERLKNVMKEADDE